MSQIGRGEMSTMDSCPIDSRPNAGTARPTHYLLRRHVLGHICVKIEHADFLLQHEAYQPQFLHQTYVVYVLQGGRIKWQSEHVDGVYEVFFFFTWAVDQLYGPSRL